jgi:hypothetical protein
MMEMMTPIRGRGLSVRTAPNGSGLLSTAILPGELGGAGLAPLGEWEHTPDYLRLMTGLTDGHDALHDHVVRLTAAGDLPTTPTRAARPTMAREALR